LLPLMVQSQFGYDATTAGLIFTPGAVALLFLMPVSGKLVAKVQSRYLIAVGLLLITFGMYYTANVTPQTDYNMFVFMRFLQVLGLPFLFIPVSTLAFSNIPRERSSKASALFALGRNLGGAIGIGIATNYLAHHEQMEQMNLSSHLTAGDPVYENRLSTLTNALIAHGSSAANAAHSAMGSIYQELLHQSTILAYTDTFRFMACLLAGAACLTFFLPANKISKAAAAKAARMHTN
jgi:DHA2 family multidrug resistance protein